MHRHLPGFQNGSVVPPKTLSAIRANPDMYSSEYQSSSSEAGLMEIFTPDCEYQPLFIAQSDSRVHSHSRAGGNEDRNQRDETQKHGDSDKREWVVGADLEQERFQQP